MRIKLLLTISFLALAVLFLVTLPDKKTRVIFCDVEQGDGILIIKNNFQMLVDTGPENKKILNCLEKHMPFWDKKIEAVVITHWDSDHSGGLKDLEENFKIDQIFCGIEHKSCSAKIEENDILRFDKIDFEVVSNEGIEGKGVDESNGGSVVGMLKIFDKNFLMMGDAPGEIEQKMVWRGVLQSRILEGKIDVLKVSHHGSGTATTDELLDFTKPKEAVISVGKNNFGHPTKEVLERLKKRGIKIQRTDESGDIIYVL